MGDISPIKLEDGGNHHGSSPPSSYRHPYDERPPPVEFAPSPHYGHQEWRSSHDGYSYPPSNPLFVLRSIHRAFDGCSYKLSCLRDRDVCPVNISQYASIRHYHDEVRKAWIVLFFFKCRKSHLLFLFRRMELPTCKTFRLLLEGSRPQSTPLVDISSLSNCVHSRPFSVIASPRPRSFTRTAFTKGIWSRAITFLGSWKTTLRSTHRTVRDRLAVVSTVRGARTTRARPTRVRIVQTRRGRWFRLMKMNKR
jgi:hypothetical protein